MPASVIVWDIETVPDLRGFAAANGLIGKPDDEVRAEIGDKFPKLVYHSIVCIGALVAQVQLSPTLERYPSELNRGRDSRIGLDLLEDSRRGKGAARDGAFG